MPASRSPLRPRLAALASLVLATLSIASALPANATISEVMGGPGGGPFMLKCDSRSALVGFEARAGAWVDAIGIVCATVVDPKTGRTAPQRMAQGMTGGPDGVRQESYCPAGSSIVGIGLAHTRGHGLPRQYVNTVDLYCQGNPGGKRCISSGQGCGSIAPIIRGPIISIVKEYAFDQIGCPAGEVAKGIHGRSGKFVDAIGLICEEPASGAVRRAR